MFLNEMHQATVGLCLSNLSAHLPGALWWSTLYKQEKEILKRVNFLKFTQRENWSSTGALQTIQPTLLASGHLLFSEKFLQRAPPGQTPNRHLRSAFKSRHVRAHSSSDRASLLSWAREAWTSEFLSLCLRTRKPKPKFVLHPLLHIHLHGEWE